MHMVACSACHGEGARFTRPSRHALHEHHLAVAAAAAADSEPPQRPPPRRVPCKVCCATGLVQNSAPDTPAPEFGSAIVAIVGGGIGGAAAALALQQRGLNAVVYERDASFDERAQGYGLTMQQGANALRDLGLCNRGIFSIAHHSFLPDGTLLGSYGRAVHERTRDALGNGKGDAQRRNAHIPRQDLRKGLLEALPASTVHWGKRLERVEVRTGASSAPVTNAAARDGVVLHFADGTSALADVAVGADGIWSTMRRHLLPDPAERSSLRYLGVVVVLGRAPCGHPLAQQQVFQTLDGQGTRLYAMPFSEARDGDDGDGACAVTMWQLSFLMSEEAAQQMPRDGLSLLAEARRRVAGWHEPIEHLIGATAPEDVTGYPAYDRDVPCALRWQDADLKASRDPAASTDSPRLAPECPCTLLGDAAHPMSPFKGQGANQALVDAVDLARALRRSTLCGGELSIGDALCAFETSMLRRAAPKVVASRSAAEILHTPQATVACNGVRAIAAQTMGGGPEGCANDAEVLPVK